MQHWYRLLCKYAGVYFYIHMNVGHHSAMERAHMFLCAERVPRAPKALCCPPAPSSGDPAIFLHYSALPLSGRLVLRGVCITVVSWILNVYQFRTNR